MKQKRVITKWEPDNFSLESTTHWSFPERGNWATHDGDWRGNWSPYIPRNIILRYSEPEDWVLDQFVGGGTTLVEAKLLNRHSVGVDVNEVALARCRDKIDFDYDMAKGKVFLRKGNATALTFIPDERIDLICTHPPYANIIRYSEDVAEDLSRLDDTHFLQEMSLVAGECYRVLKRGKFCAILMGDIRRQGCMVPLSFSVMRLFEQAGFSLKEIITKEQHHCRMTPYWRVNSVKHNFLLIAHEHLFVFKK